MPQHLKLRVIVDDNDFRRLDVPTGLPETLEELHNAIRESFDIENDFRIQFMDPDFNDEFMNATSIKDIKDRATIKLVYIQHCASVSPPLSLQSIPGPSYSTEAPASSQRSPSVSSQYSSSADSDGTILLHHSDSELRVHPWPHKFPIPRFSYNVETQLQRGNEHFRETGITMKITPGLKSEILEKLAEEIFQFTAYPQNFQIDDVARSLIQKFPCLKELSATGYYAWMISLKYKMANYRTKMRNIGCPEVSVNALKNKPRDECLPAKNVKRPKKAEVNFCPSHPTGETDESLEKLRVELLDDVKWRNSMSCVKEKMARTFSFRRKEIVQGEPLVQVVKARWPALFQINEVNAEFQRITTIPLETTFMAQLDKVLANLKSVFQKKGGQTGQKLAKPLRILQEETNGISHRRAAALKALCIYFGEDDSRLIQEYTDSRGDDILKDMQKSSMGIYVINKEGGVTGHLDDIGVHVEGVTVLDNIGSEAQACAMMLGLIYALNMAYPKELRNYYEFIQKVLMQMDGERPSPKVLGLKNKIFAEL
ncbi:uncharacterized protein LOC141807753 [Halichoeres trimaculatus]|uniref:uncharacterized protein LOC141807753 n=1 Tax=Halichoeres trimaculatus TaxID=147232 RepID=UPI003D9E2D58